MILPDDMILEIASYLDDTSKLAWISACRRHRSLICKIKLYAHVKYHIVAKWQHRYIFQTIKICDDEDVKNYTEDDADYKEIIFWGIFRESIDLSSKSSLSIKFRYLYVNAIILPNTIKYVEFSGGFNHPIRLPEGLISAVFGGIFDQHVTLPSTMRHVVFGGAFDHPVVLPEGLLTLEFGYLFCQLIKLPSTLTSVTFGQFFNRPVNLPEGLKSATFGYYFDQPVILPPGIERVIFLGQFGNLRPWPRRVIGGAHLRADYVSQMKSGI